MHNIFDNIFLIEKFMGLKVWTLRAECLPCFLGCGAWEWFECIRWKMPWGKLLQFSLSCWQTVSITPTPADVLYLIRVWVCRQLPIVALPLGNSHPYFTFSASETFFDMSAKPFFSHTCFFLEELIEVIAERKEKPLGMDGRMLQWGPLALTLFASIPPKKVKDDVSLPHFQAHIWNLYLKLKWLQI